MSEATEATGRLDSAREAADTPSDDENDFEDCQEALDVDEDIERITGAVAQLEVATDFSLEKLHVYFAQCMGESEELSITEYILGYREVYKFLTLLGSVFTWVAADVQAKIEILHTYNTGDSKHNYKTIKLMLEFEVEKNMINKNKRDDASGSRTLLRLHRALEFVVTFLGKLDEIELSDKCAPISRVAYEQTLSRYHIWPIQKAAKFAMALLPTKAGLVQKVCPEAEKDGEAMKKVMSDFVQAVQSMSRVYSTAQVLYEEKDLLNLP